MTSKKSFKMVEGFVNSTQIDGGEKREARLMGKMFPVGANMSQSWDSMRLFERETGWSFNIIFLLSA